MSIEKNIKDQLVWSVVNLTQYQTDSHKTIKKIHINNKKINKKKPRKQ